MTSRADELQRLAANPSASVWVAASAGTGKTKVLTDRVLNLLLEGAAPQKVLCLTFTRAAAGEMQNRLHHTLSQWVLMSVDELRQRLLNLLGYQPSQEQMQRARRLFTQVLDTPGGMKILTIHGFCQSILKRFPLEAKLSPHFKVMDENQATLLLQQVQNNLLRSNHDIRPYLYQLTDVFDDVSFTEMLTYLMADRQKWTWILEEPQAIYRAKSELQKILGISLDMTTQGLVENATNNSSFDYETLQKATEALKAGSSSDQDRAEVISQWLTQGNDRNKLFAVYKAVFLTEKGEIRKRLVTKKIADLHPEIAQGLLIEAERLQTVNEKIHSLECGQRSWAIIQLGVIILEEYLKEKQKRCLLDYDDLIEQTARLLRQPSVAPWVLFKLDGGLDHILVDEAQDTNLYQWTVISALAEDFFSGEGARTNNRTIFIVGDAKQSIYSFQGADPFVFDEMRRFFGNITNASRSNWHEITLNVSFRSTKAVLETVDKVFAQTEASDGVAIQEEQIKHHSFRKEHGGSVELWPLLFPTTEESVPAWTPPLSIQDQGISPPFRLASIISAQIRDWLDNGELLISKGRKIQARDVLVLVRRRSTFVDALVSALKQDNIPFAGSDRLQLISHLAVQDLIALGKFVIQPADDLNLACVLKGPLLNLNEDDLFELAYSRGDKSLWQCLLDKGEKFKGSIAFLEEIRQRGKKMPPFDFYARLLGELGGKKSLLRRLSYEALDPIDEFLNLVQQYQLTNIPSLLGFITWLSSGEIEIKRDLDQGDQDEVRIMTVHGAKGLQAPIVFLPDTVQVPRYSSSILWAPQGNRVSIPIWSPPAGKECHATSTLKQTAQNQIEQEYRRLLYVALTRAEDRLYVCGWQTSQEASDLSWYKLVENAVKDIGQPIDYDFTKLSIEGWQGQGWRHSCPQLVETTSETSSPDFSIPEAPTWLFKKPHLEEYTKSESPSKGNEQTDLPDEVFHRGKILHKLLQYLPDVPVDMRMQAGLQLLKTMKGVPIQEHSGLINDVMRVLNDPKITHLFSHHARTEVPVSARINGKVVLGQIDRLLVTDREVIIIDYKTNRKPPTNIQEIPTIYRHQLSTYKEILQRIYLHHTIRCILLWTETLEMIEVPTYLLDKPISPTLY